MEDKPIGRLSEHMGKVKDPRIGNATRHKFIDNLVIAICAVVCGADGWSAVALFGRSKQKGLKTFLELPHGSHWGIENRWRWVLDVAFREDVSRVRKDHAPANFAILRHMALNMLKQEKSAKVGIQAKRLQAGWDENYLLSEKGSQRGRQAKPDKRMER